MTASSVLQGLLRLAVNECLLGTDNCAIVGSICIDLVDGFKCECDKTEGYTGNGTHCDKLDDPVCPGMCKTWEKCRVHYIRHLCLVHAYEPR